VVDLAECPVAAVLFLSLPVVNHGSCSLVCADHNQGPVNGPLKVERAAKRSQFLKYPEKLMSEDP
jgi:hypothetical protein